MNNESSVPNTCALSTTLNENRHLQTVYNSKCNDHLTPMVFNTSNAVKDIRSNHTWSNVRGFGYIQQYTCDNQVSVHKWNHVPRLDVSKNNSCA